MKKNFTMVSGVLSVITLLLFVISCKKEEPRFCNCNPNDIVITQSDFGLGLNNPRGLKFGPDGNLYVAEGGVGGTNSTIGQCDQVPGAGPYTGSVTGARISRFDHSGSRTTVADNIPSSTTSPNIGGFISGVADVAFIGHTLYGLLTGAGCSHGVIGIDNGVFKVNKDKTWTLINDMSTFWKNNPVANPNPHDFEPDGTPYSMISQDDHLFVLEPNHGELDKVSTDGNIKRIIDISAFEGHIVPTCVTYHEGNFYVGNLDEFPIAAGGSNIYKITPGGKITTYATGFTYVLGVLVDPLGGLYVLENTVGHDFPTPGSGDIIRVDPDGSRMTIISNLDLPTAMTFGPDEKLYVSDWGYGGAPGMGKVIQLDLTCAKANGFKKIGKK
ncbi:MAG TPA: ScyD/ScyE family protein [Chitinophagaceae bacterium]|jgi:hypothetical protein|nr:ScyD/ScyE family protein [Chitinophagaceae bacterium]